MAGIEHDKVTRHGLCPQDVHRLTRRQTHMHSCFKQAFFNASVERQQCRGHRRGRKNFYYNVWGGLMEEMESEQISAG